MANKQSNKQKTECCGQGCNNHENMNKPNNNTCGYGLQIVGGILLIGVAGFILLNTFL